MKEGIIETLNVIPAGVVIIDSKENKIKFANDDLINLLATDQLEKAEMT
jgi:hypothetical protein